MKKRILLVTTSFTLAGLGILLTAWLLTPQPVYAAVYTVGGACGGTVQACLDFAAPGDTVVVPAGTWNESITLSEPISLTGVSSATAVLQALPGQRVLTVTGAAIDHGVVISGLTFRGGDVSGGSVCFSGGTANCGGGILLTNNAQPRIQHVIIEDNTAYRGGGLYANETGALWLDHVVFRNNTVLLTGGGLQAPNTPVTVTNSLFLQNTTTNNVGGALAASASFGIVAPVLISGSTFLSNTAQCLGGTFGICEAPAVYLFDQDVRIVNSRFEDNRCTAANCDGGGVFMLSSFNAPAMRIENSDFLGNTAGGSGGGVSVGNLAQFVVVNGRFENNRALAGDGGGLNHGNFLIAAFADVSGTQFISNSAALEGGGLNSVSDVAIRGARFERNASSTDGGGLFVDFGGAGSRLTNTLFLSNTAQSEGGGAFVFGDGLIVSGGSFVGNSATADGGGLHACGSVTLTNPVFSGNVTQENGGGAYVGPRENIGGCGSGANSVAVSDGRFEANRSLDPPTFFSEGGGGLYVLGSATLTNTDFLANQAAALGGGVYVQESAVLSSGSFQNNVAAGSNGGGIRAAGSLTVDGTQFVGNVAGFAGGGAQVGNTLGSGQSIIRNALFQNNQADSGGGLQSSITLTLDNVQFLSNVAITTSGGGLSAFDALTVTNSLFQGNSSAGNGGGLNSFSGPFILANTQFLGNAALNGGGLYYAFNALSATDVTIQGNSAISNGGGLATSGSAVFSGSWTVSGNTAGQDGGGIWANSGLNAVGGRIENNRSLGNGGGFYGGLAQMRVDGTVFALNRTAGSGGGAYAFDGAAIGNALFSGNTANGAGGGLFLQRFVHITATQFLGNRAGQGGGLAVIRSSTGTLVQDITNSVFARNTATGRGADFFYDQPRPINLLHNTFARDGQAVGAAVYVAAGTVALTNTIITSHTVGIENAGGTVSADYTLFFDNGSDLVGTVNSSSSLAGNPTFVNAAGDDFRLVDGSLAVDSGANAGVFVDLLGVARPRDAGFDLGAYEGRHTPTAVSLTHLHAAPALPPLWLMLLGLLLLGGLVHWRR